MSQGLLTGESTSITIDQYNKLQDGMTIEEVQAIAGSGNFDNRRTNGWICKKFLFI